MIGRVRYTDADGTVVTATLGDDRKWSCPEWPSVATLLNLLHGPDPDGGPSAGAPGHAQLHAAAARCKGEVIDLAPADPDDGRLY